MDEAEKIVEIDTRTKDHARRIEKLEHENGVLHSLATSVAVMAEQLKNNDAKLGQLCVDVQDLKDQPAEKWNSLVKTIIASLVGIALGAMFASIK